MHSNAFSPNRREFLAATASTAATLLAAGRLATAEEGAPLRAGAATADVTPEPGVLLDGTIMKIGPVRSVHDPLHARALVLDDGRERIAFCVCDATVISREVFDRAKARIAAATGIPAGHQLLAATHSHSAIRVIGLHHGQADVQYVDKLVDGIVEAVGRAVADLAPAEVGWGVGEKPEFVFNRRWHMKPGTIPPNPFGQRTDRVQFNPPRGSANLVEPAGPVDPQVSVLSVRHADGRPLALLANFGIHYCGGFKRQEVSADYFGVFARRIGELAGAETTKPPCVGILTNGTSGDVSNGIPFRERPARKAPYEWMEEVGNAVAEEALRVTGEIEHRSRVTLAMAETELELGVRRPDEARLAWARQVQSDPQAKTPHHWTRIYAREAIELAEFPPTVRAPLAAVRIGSLGIAAVPCEVFAETGLAIKAASPLEPTFVVEIANAYHGYLPTPEQHAWGGYETWPARSSYLEVDAEPKIRRAVLELLGEVQATEKPQS